MQTSDRPLGRATASRRRLAPFGRLFGFYAGSAGLAANSSFTFEAERPWCRREAERDWDARIKEPAGAGYLRASRYERSGGREVVVEGASPCGTKLRFA